MITPSDKFAGDISKTNTLVYPLVQIDGKIFISQVKESFAGEIYEDHNLKVSNIKQSINFESRKFKISNVTITFSNYANLTDKLNEIDIMNKPVTVYWKTQSCTTLDDCLRVYQANVRRYLHDEKTVTIQLEDNSQEKFKKDVPIANLGESDFVYSKKYTNKYIPITYGEHDYAPAVIWKPSHDALRFEIICDDVYDIAGAGRSINTYLDYGVTGGTYYDVDRVLTTLRAHKGVYVDIKSVYEITQSLNPAEYNVNECYQVDPNKIFCELYFSAGNPLNPLANNEFQAEFRRYPSGFEFISDSNTDFEGNPTDSSDWQTDDLSHPEAAFSQYGNFFHDSPLASYCEIPDSDLQTPLELLDDQEEWVDQALNLFNDWKEEHLGEYRALTPSHESGYENVNESGFTTSGDIFGFDPSVVVGVSFYGSSESGGRLYYNYGFDNSDPDNLVPWGAPTDADVEADGSVHPEKFKYAGVNQGIDWVGWRHGDFASGATYIDPWDSEEKTTYPNRFGQEGYMFKSEPTLDWDDINDDLHEYKKIGMVVNSSSLTDTEVLGYMPWNNSDHDGKIRHKWETISDQGMPNEEFNYYEKLRLSIPDDDTYNKEYMSPIPRIKYLHAANNFAFIQLPSANQIKQRLFDMGLTSLGANWMHQCRPTDPYMGRFSQPYNPVTDNYPLWWGGFDDGMLGGEYIGNRTFEYYQRLFCDDNFAVQRNRRYLGFYGAKATDDSSGWIPWDDGEIGHWGGFHDPYSNGDGFMQLSHAQQYSCSYSALSGYTPLQGCDFYTGGYHNMIQPHIAEMKPYGNIVWIFGHSQEGANSNLSNQLSDTTGGDEDRFGNVHQYTGVTFCNDIMDWTATRWHASGEESNIQGCGEGYSGQTAGWGSVTFPASNPTGLDPYTKYTESEFAVTGHDSWSAWDHVDAGQRFVGSQYSLSDLFDLREFPMYIPFELQDEGAGIDFGETQEGMQAFFIRPTYRCFWNGIEPDGTALWGDSGAGVKMGFLKGTSEFYDGGQYNWFALSLKDMGNYTKAGSLQSCYGAYASDSQNAGISYGEIVPGGGVAEQYTSDHWINLKAPISPAFKGKALGLRFKLPEIGLQDNIDLAHTAFWKRKIHLTRKYNEDLSDADLDSNFITVVANAIDIERIHEQIDILKTSTLKFSPSIADINTAAGSDSSTPPQPLPLVLDNIGGTSTLDELESKFDGTGTEAALPWGNANDFDALNVYVLGEATDVAIDAGVTLQTQWNIKIYSNYTEHVVDFKNFSESDFFVKCKGRQNGADTIENPSDVIKDIVLTELNLPPQNINSSSFSQAASDSAPYKLAFSIKDKIDSKKMIEDICLNTSMFPLVNYENKLSLVTIKNEYNTNDYIYNPSTDTNEDKKVRLIKYDRIISYKFNKSKLDDIKTKVMVKYDVDYSSGEFRRNTGWFSVKDFLGDGDLDGDGETSGHQYLNPEGEPSGYRCGHYNLDISEKDSELVFETKYIRDRNAAYRLQEFLAMWYCNQHMIISLDLDVSYVYLEVGDIVYFDTLLEDVKAYGRDYTESQIINGQEAYPLFMVEEINKSNKKVSLKATQLHNLSKQFEADKGDISRNGLKEYYDMELLLDYTGFGSLPHDNRESYTRHQVISMDVNNTNNVTDADYMWLAASLGYELEE